MKKRVFAIASALCLMPALALAQQGGNAYLGGGIGRGSASGADLPPFTISGVTVSASGGTTTDTAYKLFGGYQFDQNWGLEVGYNNLGNGYSKTAIATAGGASVPLNVTAKVDNWYVAGTGTLPLGTSGFSLSGKLGLVRNSTNVGNICAFGICAAGGSASSTRSQALVGVGIKYGFNKNLSGILEYEDYGKTSKDDLWQTGTSGALKANAWYLSLRYDF